MIDKEKIKVIKDDLKNLRNLNKSIESYISMERRHRKLLDYLDTIPETSISLTKKAEIIDRIGSIDIGDCISRAIDYEKKYLEIIDKLPPLDRKIIMDGFISGKPYWKIGNEIGYSTRGIENRVSVIVKQIAKNIK